MNTKKLLLICLGILLLAAAIVVLIFNTEPTAQAEAAVKKTAMLVDVVEVEEGNYTPVIVANGIVEPVNEVIISPQVGGQIIHRSPDFIPGGFVKKNELLLQIEPSDYKNDLEMRRSELQQAQTDLAMEMGGQKVAQQDLELAGVDSLSPSERSLILREPQLEAVKARIRAARAAVEQGQLELSRTSIRAPFDAHILNQEVTVGAQVAPGDNLGRLVGTDFYWAVVSLPVDKLQWLEFPDTDSVGSTARFRSSNWPEGVFRRGSITKRIGALDEETRLAQVMGEIEDPLVTKEKTGDVPELVLGTFVEAHLEAKEIENVVRLNRNYVRSNETVWVMKDGKLDIREVEVILTDAEYAYIGKGLQDQDKVVTTNLSTVSEGISLRTQANSNSEANNLPKETEE